MARSSETRSRIKRAALQLVEERGYYIASSNQIALRANVTWGAIQHHFGSYASLVTEVAYDVLDESATVLENTPGAPLQPRELVEQLVSLAVRIYSRPEFMLAQKILADQNSNPDTTERVHEIVLEYQQRVARSVERLILEALGDARLIPTAMAIFAMARGYGLSEETIRAINPATRGFVPASSVMHVFLVDSMTAQLESHILNLSEHGAREDAVNGDR